MPVLNYQCLDTGNVAGMLNTLLPSTVGKQFTNTPRPQLRPVLNVSMHPGWDAKPLELWVMTAVKSSTSWGLRAPALLVLCPPQNTEEGERTVRKPRT